LTALSFRLAVLIDGDVNTGIAKARTLPKSVKTKRNQNVHNGEGLCSIYPSIPLVCLRNLDCEQLACQKAESLPLGLPRETVKD